MRQDTNAYSRIPTATLRDLLDKANALRDGREFDLEINLKVKISGQVDLQGGETFVEDLEVEVTQLPQHGQNVLSWALLENVEGSLHDWITESEWASVPCIEEIVIGIENEVEDINTEVDNLEDNHELPGGDLLFQLEEKSGVSLS